MSDTKEKLILDHRLLRILEHFRLAKVDYVKNVTRYTEIRQELVISYVKELENYGFLERYTNTSIKRTAAKLKRSAEVHKHHTYFRITRSGNSILNEITPDDYARLLGFECISMLMSKVLCEDSNERCAMMVKMGVLDKNLKITPIGERVLLASP